MNVDECAQVRRWVCGGCGDEPPKPLVHHAARCPACAGALALLALDAEGQRAVPVRCGASPEELAAFVEIEARAGLDAAIETLPAVWQRLLSCDPDLTAYRATSLLAALRAVRDGEAG